MSVETVQDGVDGRIERFLMDAFISNRSIDPQAVAEELVRKGVDLPLADLHQRVRLAANGLSVRLK